MPGGARRFQLRPHARPNRLDPLFVRIPIGKARARKILALRRSVTDTNRPLSWDLPGGEVEKGEDLKESIIREVKEEAGLVILAPKILDVVGMYDRRGDYWVSIGYFALVPKDAAVILSFEHDQFEWISREEFLSRESTSRIKHFLQNPLVVEASNTGA